MNQTKVVEDTKNHVETLMRGEASGHDWWHVYRVWKMALHLAELEKGADKFVVSLGALLHDIADWKFNGGDIEVGPRKAREWLESINVDESVIDKVTYIVHNVSYRGGTNTETMNTLEGKIVQDADRLDALGAMGIARTFAFGGSRNREMYDPDKKPLEKVTFEAYQKAVDNGTTINHFYEKLLLLKDKMNTQSARKIARHRHEHMEAFLTEFYAEWNGER